MIIKKVLYIIYINYGIIFQLFQLISYENDIGKFLIHLLYMIVIFIYMFLSNYAGQEITDHHNRIFITA